MSTTAPAVKPRKRLFAPASGPMSWGEDMVTMLLSAWLIAGLAVDGWAHTNLTELETFFTPWHALFYSGFSATATWILWATARRRAPGQALQAAVPAGYELGMVGLGLFALGGVGDMLWHVAFGIEVGVDALLSPSHLVLYSGIFLIVTSPFRAAWRREAVSDRPGIRAFAPVLASATLAAGLTSFMFLYLSPFFHIDIGSDEAGFIGNNFRGNEYLVFLNSRSGVATFLLSTVVLVAPVLLLLRRWRLPFGSCAVLFGAVATVIQGVAAFGHRELIVAAVAGGAAADLLAAWLKPATSHPYRFRTFAGLAPLALWGAYVMAVALTEGIGWELELWSGAVLWTGLLGLGLSMLVLPPAGSRPAEGA
jgi:hypothetical protein